MHLDLLVHTHAPTCPEPTVHAPKTATEWCHIMFQSIFK
jgi:hypothetical protein